MTVPEQLGGESPKDHEPSPLYENLRTEYFKIVDIVTDFDQRLLTIKGWGVTLSLASIGIGFQQRHYGLFLVAAISGLAFWLVEGVTKVHQMRYYPRMGDIEVAAYNLYRTDTKDGPVSSPLIDWGWYTAGPRVRGGALKGDPDPNVPKPWPKSANRSGSFLHRLRNQPLVYPHVLFPHLVSFSVGTALFLIGLSGQFGSI